MSFEARATVGKTARLVQEHKLKDKSGDAPSQSNKFRKRTFKLPYDFQVSSEELHVARVIRHQLHNYVAKKKRKKLRTFLEITVKLERNGHKVLIHIPSN